MSAHPRLLAELRPKTRLFQDLCPVCPLLRSRRKIWRSKGFRQAHFTPSHLHYSGGEVHAASKLRLTVFSLRARLLDFVLPLSLQISQQVWIASVQLKIMLEEPFDTFVKSWDDKYFHSSTAHFTTFAFQLVSRMDSLRTLRDLPFHKMQSGSATKIFAAAQIVFYDLSTSIVFTRS